MFEDKGNLSTYGIQNNNSTKTIESLETYSNYELSNLNRKDQDLYLIWKNIDVKLDVRKPGASFFSKERITLHLMDNNSGYAKSGECLAILGGSGAGKSTLLNILADRFNVSKNIHYQRDVKLNKEPLVWDKFKNIAGFVMQTSKFFSDQKIEEVLRLNAALKFGNMNETELTTKVNSAIEFLKLQNARSTLVGGLFRKAISGGEQKRLSIGGEIIREPKILFLDEPTSGLDSYTSFLIVQRLRILAREFNMIIIYTIHQPSLNIYNMFDNLMVLNKGKTVYFGSAKSLQDHFASIKYMKTGYVPPSEVLINAAIKGLPIIDTPFFEENAIQNKQSLEEIENNISDVIINKSINRPSFCRQFGLMTMRNFKNYIRNPMTFHIRIAQAIFLSAVFALMYANLAPVDLMNPITINNRLGAYYFMGCIIYVGYFMLTALICKFSRSSRARDIHKRI